MKRKLSLAVCLWLMVGILLIASFAVVAAMSSPGFLLDWYVNISGAGGGNSSSTQTTANYTIGQNTAGAASSPNFKVEMGYWGAFPFQSYLYLPTVMEGP